MTHHQIVDISIIKEMLPHRDPFLFVDRVVEFKSNETITTEKELLPDMVFFAGHFPGTPIMPGVLTTEALAQAVAGRSQRDTDLKSVSKEKIRRLVYV
ncbi:MAG: hypothetical protein JRJ39_09105 [Deltaproteobacteria bacterium]|nr:hypothetical protein [Deltaproteobacteria bacterium]